MKYFRIHIYLNVKNFFKSLILFNSKKNYDVSINKILIKNSNKKFSQLTSQCRISFLLILKFFKKKFPDKREIIFLSYNLPEMINVAKNLNFKPVLCDLDYKTGFFNTNNLKKNINKNTIAIVLTNMFGSYEQSINIKKICAIKKIYLIEDNAIYFDNYKIIKNTKKYTGRIGDFTIYSFNIMKNISAMYGGAVTSNIKEFNLFVKKELLTFGSFPKKTLIKQIFIFFILKILSNNFLYKNIFFKIIKVVYLKNIKPILRLFYPSLKFKVIRFPNYYFTNISFFAKKLIFFQLIDYKNRISTHKKRRSKNFYYYNKLNKNKIYGIKLLKVSDFNYQNFIDFPLLVKKRSALNKFLLNNGIETRLYYYRNCGKIFSSSQKNNFSNSEKYENQILCLPNGEKITYEYIDYIIKTILIFYSKKKIL